tara:strand:+ start:4684 stop:4845 length:162 start_codon:yes stop_codon:yes gene_type:complete
VCSLKKDLEILNFSISGTLIGHKEPPTDEVVSNAKKGRTGIGSPLKLDFGWMN